MCNLSSPQFYV